MNREVKIIELSYSQSQSNSYVCILSEIRGFRKLPIIIKTSDAQTIAMNFEKMSLSRPTTHDLVKSISDLFDLDCREIQIYQILEGIFYARLVITNGFDEFEIECSAGDALALSLNFDCPIFVDEKVLESAGITTDEEGNPLESDTNEEVEKSNEVINKNVKSGVTFSVDELTKLLETAVNNEDYELAAKYRDKISELEKK